MGKSSPTSYHATQETHPHLSEECDIDFLKLDPFYKHWEKDRDQSNTKHAEANTPIKQPPGKQTNLCGRQSYRHITHIRKFCQEVKMPPQFKNMDELVNYMAEIETQLAELRRRTEILKDGQVNASRVPQLPKTNLLSKHFLNRAFAVWGHFIVANLIISAILGSIYFCIFVTLLQSIVQVSSSQPVTPVQIIPGMP